MIAAPNTDKRYAQARMLAKLLDENAKLRQLNEFLLNEVTRNEC